MLHQALEEIIYIVYESYIFNGNLQYVRKSSLGTFSSKMKFKMKFKTVRPTALHNW